MSMYTHAITHARMMRNQDVFRAQTQVHTDDLLEVIRRLVVQELFIAPAATAVAWAYMQT